MVDSVNGAGGPSNISQVNRNQSAREERRTEGASGAAAPADEVQLSDEALEAQAEDTAREARAQLEEQPDATLTRGDRFDTLL